jgi:hypothetical protein
MCVCLKCGTNEKNYNVFMIYSNKRDLREYARLNQKIPIHSYEILIRDELNI